MDITDQGITGPDPLGMSHSELYDFVRAHARECLCAWRCDMDARVQDLLAR